MKGRWRRNTVVALTLSLPLVGAAVWLACRPAGPTIRPTDPEVVASWCEDGNLFALDISPSGRLAAGAFVGQERKGISRSYYVKVWDLRTGTQAVRVEEQAEVNAVAFSADGGLLAWGVTGDTVRLRDTRTWRDHAVIPPM